MMGTVTQKPAQTQAKQSETTIDKKGSEEP